MAQTARDTQENPLKPLSKTLYKINIFSCLFWLIGKTKIHYCALVIEKKQAQING